MRTRITGTLLGVEPDRLELRLDHAGGHAEVFELLIPPVAAEDLAPRTGETVTLLTHEFLEGQGQGASFLPRTLGFADATQKRVFDLLTGVKGLGPRRALRVMKAPADRIARAIAEGDAAFLRTLPEIGKKTADTMVLELRDRVGELGLTRGVAAGDVEAKLDGDAGRLDDAAQQAVAALVHLGEGRAEAEALVRKALRGEPETSAATPDALLAAALALRS